MKKLERILFYSLAVLSIGVCIFTSTHHAIYGNCHKTYEGKTCDLLKWVGNK